MNSLIKNKIISAVIFDMDGVLIDAKEWHFIALNKALSLFGLEISRYDHISTYDGLPTRKKLEMLSKERKLPIELHEFINKMKQQYTMELVYSQCKPKFIHEYALSRLRADGFKLAVASNSIRETVEVMMRKAALHQYLEFSLSNEDVKNGKPDPEIYSKAIELLGIHPERCLVIEDNEKGVAAASKAGAHVMQVDEVWDVNYESIIKHINNLTIGDSA